MSDSDANELLCRELVELVSEYLAANLSDEERARFDEHLLGCPPCTEYLAQMRTTIELARGLGSAPSEPLTQSLLEVFRSWSHK